MTRVLFLSHGHPENRRGGAEIFAYNLFRGLRQEGSVKPFFLARTFEAGHARSGETESPFRAFGGRADEMLWYTGDYDHLMLSLVDRSQYYRDFRGLLEFLQPDLVHVQHTDGIGLPVLSEIRRVLPSVRVVYTLHELLPICHARGHMVRERSSELCTKSSPVRCHECFPLVPPAVFSLRQHVVRHYLDAVDVFVAPSRFLIDRYLEWGLPPEKLMLEDYGCAHRPPAEVMDHEPPIDRFGFFGQLSADKGVEVLLDAFLLLCDRGGRVPHLYLNGANFELQAEAFRASVSGKLDRLDAHVTVLGSYEPGELAGRMRDVAWVVVPSIWWENSPLVIQEAFAHRRPVIASDIGGMAEKVTNDVDGLHFKTGDAASLAGTIQKASEDVALWRRLREGIRPVRTLQDSVAWHLELYESLLPVGRVWRVEA